MFIIFIWFEFVDPRNLSWEEVPYTLDDSISDKKDLYLILFICY
jgi:hypothetical protein